MRNLLTGIVCGVVTLACASAFAYPVDAYERTKIRRLKWQSDIDAGTRRGRKNPPGGLWTSDRVVLRMTGPGRDFNLTSETPKDKELQSGLEAILKKYAWRAYNVAVLDISDPNAPRFAAVHENEQQTPGSVAKVLVGAALFDQLRQRFPNDIAAREAMLRDTPIVADYWSMPNHHEVPVFSDPNLEHVAVRRIRNGDTFSLWEWLDHALSVSSNSAATTVWREAILMKLLGEGYPPGEGYTEELFKKWDKATFTQAAFDVIDAPLIAAGIDPAAFKLRLFFTKMPGKHITADSCRVSPLAALQWLLRLEQGRIVDEFSSLELKRLLYLTRRRIRYVYAPQLHDSAVFFKSGSLYGCVPEEGFQCGKYMGNKINVLNSIVTVETVSEVVEPPQMPVSKLHVYMVSVMSNELRRNAANDHAALGAAIHQLIVGQK